MSQPDPAPTDPAPANNPTPPAGDPPNDGLGDAGKKALADERAARKTAEAELAKYRKAEQEKADADKTEIQKAADLATAATARADAAEARALRLEVAAAKGLKPGQAKRLQGTTKEELEADADEMLADLKPADPADPGKSRNPAPDPSQGAKTPSTTRPTSLGQAVGAALKKA